MEQEKIMEEEEEFVEDDEFDDKELITIVRANAFLYNKSEKLYSNTEMKKLAWAAVGQGLSKKKTGTEAEHRFWKLRERFGRERKKIIQSQGRSGAGAIHMTYTPQWNLYNELMFLADVIKHRKTTSNYKRKCPTHEAVSQLVHIPSTFISSSPSSSSLQNEELSLMSYDNSESLDTFYNEASSIPQLSSYSESAVLSKTDSSKISQQIKANKMTQLVHIPSTVISSSPSSSSLNLQNEELSLMSSKYDNSESLDTFYNETSSIPQLSSYSESAVLSKTDNSKISKQMQQIKANKMTQLVHIPSTTYKKRVPESDHFVKRQKLNVDALNKSILDQSKHLNILAQKVGDALSTNVSSPSHISHTIESANLYSLEVKTMLNSIGFALQKVSESKQLHA